MGKYKLGKLFMAMFCIMIISLNIKQYAVFAEEPLQESNFRGILIDPEMIEILKQRVVEKQQPTYDAWNNVLDSANKRLEQEPSAPLKWYVPGFYEDPDGHREAKGALMNDANGAYELALAYQITDSDEYAEKAAELINAWVHTVESTEKSDDSTLSFNYHFPAMIYAADLIDKSPAWTEEDTLNFSSFLEEIALPLSTSDRSNNWGNWGLVFEISIATYLNDTQLFNQSIDRWKEFIEKQIDENGHLHEEVNRNGGTHGIWYSHFTLQPQTIAAEIARLNGVFLYDYVAANGNTLEQAYDEVINWVKDPKQFPYYDGSVDSIVHITHIKDDAYLTLQNEYPASMSYFEVLNNFFNNKKAEEILNEHRPLTSAHATPHLTFTHGDLYNAYENDIKSARLNVKKSELYVGENEQLELSVINEDHFKVDSSKYDVLYYSDNESVVHVSEEGIVSANEIGEAYIEAEIIAKETKKRVKTNQLKINVAESTLHIESAQEGQINTLPFYIYGTSAGINQIEIEISGLDKPVEVPVEDSGKWSYRFNTPLSGKVTVSVKGLNESEEEIVSSESFDLNMNLNEILFTDQFNILDHWTAVQGKWDLNESTQTTTLRGHPESNGSGPALLYLEDEQWDDFIVQARLSQVGNYNGGGSVGILFRYQDEENYYHLRMETTNDNQQLLQLYKWEDGDATKLAENTIDYQSDDWYDLKIAVRGDSIKGYFNDQLLIEEQDTSHTKGTIGFRSYHRVIDVDYIEVIERTPPSLDTSELELLIEEAIVKVDGEGIYTERTYAALQDAIKMALTVLQDESTTEADLNQAIKELSNAIAGLEKNEDSLESEVAPEETIEVESPQDEVEDNKVQKGENNVNQLDQSGQQEESSLEKGEKLPNTASAMFNIMSIGMILACLGFIVMFRKKKVSS